MSASARIVLCLFLASGLSSIVGCGDVPGPATAYVSGTVTMNGSPVTAGRVMFFPTGTSGKNTGKAASGQLDSSGEFELTTYSNGDGAVVGQHTVTVLKPRGSGDAAPLGAAMPENVTVTIDGDNTFEINLTTIVEQPNSRRRGADREEEENDDD